MSLLNRLLKSPSVASTNKSPSWTLMDVVVDTEGLKV